jgi:hypothetical protein
MKPERGVLDHLLVLIGCGSAVYAVGMSLGKPAVASFLTIGAFVSLAAGYVFSVTLAKTALGKYDTYAWTFLALASAGLVVPLNQLLPDDGVPFNLLAAGWLSWMVILCGFVTWRDQTLLFLNLPCLALFGLVGTFDYWLGIVFFFVFLATSAVLYARVHFRSMADAAKSLGSPDIALLRRDSWRWVAGPEWALASAFAVILVSLVAAPLLQFSLSGVTTVVRSNLPDTITSPNRVSGQDARPDVPIGQGPVSLTEEPVFEVRAPGVTHLRTRTFAVYTGRGWSSARLDLDQAYLDPRPASLSPRTARGAAGGYAPWPGAAPAEPVRSFGRKRVDLKGFRVSQWGVPSPGPVLEVVTSDPSRFTIMPNGVARVDPPLRLGDALSIIAQAPDTSLDPGDARMFGATERFQALHTMPSNVPAPVVSFARAVTRGAVSDYERVARIKSAIESRALYNLRAKPAPPNLDPVAHFLEESREGYCDLFASAVVLAARSLGIPARYATGYLVNGRPNKDGFSVVRSKDAHAWAEVYFENWGWTVVDATEGAIAVEGAERGSASTQLDAARWEQTLDQILNGLVVGAGLLAVALWVKSARIERRAADAGRSEVGRTYTAFLTALYRATRKPRRFSQTSTEYIESLSGRLGEHEGQARALAAAFDDCLFGPTTPSKETVRELKEAVKAFRAHIGVPPARDTHAV